jgi:hypothetical protein
MRMRGKLPIFSYRDTFSLDSTLAPIIAAGLRKFKDTISSTEWGGYPNGFDTEEEWHEVLDKMIWSFENADFEIGLPPEYWEETKGMSLVDTLNRGKTPNQKAIWDEYMKNCEAHQERLVEGFDLFAKHFQSLWW